MSQDYGLRVWFVTLTLPAQHIGAIETFALYDKPIKNAYLQNLRKLWKKLYPGRKFAAEYCLISELQVGGAIHFHLSLAWTDERFAKLVKRLYRYWWWKLLKHYSIKTGCDLLIDKDGFSFWDKPGELMVECEQVEKSVESYMAKYLSKQLSKEQKGRVNTPSRWWSISSRLREKTMGERHGESFARQTFDDALAQVESVATLATEEGLEVRAMTNPFNGMPVGFVVFCDQAKKGWHFEWFKELVRNGVEAAGSALFGGYELKRSVGYG
jgi:hypothetical protein